MSVSLLLMVHAFGVTLVLILGIVPTSRSVALKHAAPCMDKIYVGTTDPSGALSGLVISTDGGETWTRRDPITDASIYSIKAIGDNVYVGTKKGIAVSHNGGRSWKITKLNPDEGYQDVKALFAVNNSVYAGLALVGRFCISNDAGETWPINVPVGEKDSDYDVYGVYAVNQRSYVGTRRKGLGISDDNGKKWKYIGKSQGLGSDTVYDIGGIGSKVFVGLDRDGGSISISEDGGQSWGIQNTTRLGLQNSVTSIFVAQDKVYVTSKGGGVSMSNDVWGTWVNKVKSDGLASDKATAVAAVGNNVYVGTDAGLSVSRDGGNTWITKGSKEGMPPGEISAVFAHSICTAHSPFYVASYA